MLAPTDDKLTMMTVTHLSSLQTLTTTPSYEDSNSIEDPYVRDAHHGHVDPQIQEEIYDVQTIDPTPTYQHEESGSILLGIPLVEQVMEIDKLMGHLLPGSACIDEIALFISQELKPIYLIMLMS